MNMHPIRVMLVDDHPVVRTGYRRLLEQGGDIAVVAEAGNGETAYGLYLEQAPDVCVTDLSMPGIGGLELLRKLLARDAAARVLVFSMHDTPQLIARALDGGACGFVSEAVGETDTLGLGTVCSGDDDGVTAGTDGAGTAVTEARFCNNAATLSTAATIASTISPTMLSLVRLTGEGMAPLSFPVLAAAGRRPVYSRNRHPAQVTWRRRTGRELLRCRQAAIGDSFPGGEGLWVS